MVSSLLDTSVVIDLIRRYEPAKQWIATQSKPAISAIVWLEVLDGVQNRRAEVQAIRMLKDFERVELVQADFDWAIDRMTKFKLSHNADSGDCLIAAVSYRLQVPLYTRNTKHFTPMLGALAQKPY